MWREKPQMKAEICLKSSDKGAAGTPEKHTKTKVTNGKCSEMYSHYEGNKNEILTQILKTIYIFFK